MSADVSAAQAPKPGAHSRNMVTALVGNGYPAMIAFFTGPILASALGVDGRGYVAAATSPLALVTTVATFGVPEAVMYVVSRNRSMARSAATRGMAILATGGVIAALALALLAPVLSGGVAEVQNLIYITSVAIVPSLLVGILRGVASAKQRWNLVTYERILSSTMRLVVLLPFWLTGTLSPLVATVAIAAMPIVGGLVYLRVLRKETEEDLAIVRAAQVVGLLSYGSRVWIGSLSGILLSRLDQTLMTPLAGTAQLGLYVVAVSISELPLIINMAVRDVTYISESTKSEDDRLTASARISTTLCAVAALVLGITMVWWLPWLFGEGFTSAVPVAAILLTAVVLLTPGSIGGSGLSARGRPGLRSIALVAACAVNIAALVILAPAFGAVGAALATLAGNVVASNLNLFFLSRKFGIPVARFYGIRASDLVIMRRFVDRLVSVIRPRR